MAACDEDAWGSCKRVCKRSLEDNLTTEAPTLRELLQNGAAAPILDALRTRTDVHLLDRAVIWELISHRNALVATEGVRLLASNLDSHPPAEVQYGSSCWRALASGLLPQACCGNREAQGFLSNLPKVLSCWCRGSPSEADAAIDIFALLHGDFGAAVAQSVVPVLASALDEPRHQRTALRVLGALHPEVLGSQLCELQTMVWRIVEQHVQDGSANVTASCRAAFRMGEAAPWSTLEHVAGFEHHLLARIPAGAVVAALSRALGDAFEPPQEPPEAAQAAEALLSSALAILENRLCDPCDRGHWASVVGCIGQCPVDGGRSRVLRAVHVIAEEVPGPAFFELLLQLQMEETHPGLLGHIADLGWGAVTVLLRQRAAITRVLQRDSRAASECAAKVLRQGVALSDWCWLFAEARVVRTPEVEAALTDLRQSITDEPVAAAIRQWVGNDRQEWWECPSATCLGPEQARVGLGCY
mmetsp:Transcript_77590/g.207309  ORF Transcript_77590/g.207309 Transcript_77590/m.207309 type:complete len:472 (+) Transcript_77590:16-1431(+)